MQGADYNKLERAEAKRIGARQHKNSGRNLEKADMSTGEFVIDAKFAKKSFTLNQDIWAKICTDTMRVDKSKSPLLYLIIGEGNQKVRLAVMEYDMLEYLLEGKNNEHDA
jgi:hypothetical protein